MNIDVVQNLREQAVKVGIPKSIIGVTFVSAGAFQPTLDALDPNGDRNFASLVIEGENIPSSVKNLMQKFCLNPEEEDVLDFGAGNYLALSRMLSPAFSMGRELYFSVKI